MGARMKALRSGVADAGTTGQILGPVALRETALAMSRASDLECDRESANLLWQELVATRWALVDRFESDGRWYLVARRNERPAVSLIDTIDRLILAQRAGGLSLKVIAYELGLSISAVGRRVRTCMTRLGVENPAELASLFGTRAR